MSLTTIRVDTQAALDGSRILAELAVSPDEPSVLRVAGEILPGVTDAVRRQLKPAGSEDDDLLAVAYAVGVVIERNR